MKIKMRRVKIYYKDALASVRTEADDGEFIFQYDKKCVLNKALLNEKYSIII